MSSMVIALMPSILTLSRFTQGACHTPVGQRPTSLDNCPFARVARHWLPKSHRAHSLARRLLAANVLELLLLKVV
eukprot:CAMPEP_0183489124 /NCGR_PEP_ID=MMETSP0370-20130417/181286_1 /TAXON_ID=268820 /ORGANISM="Peridinium aciculiferum, Strain PAER-2" /LENGTH=74 /DNA_ID=CAMNT_0025682457 /DNA_START=921 /DNA_END=1142 /DNA_ORIENTATION=+